MSRPQNEPEEPGANQTGCADQLSTKAIRLEESSTKPAAVKARKL